MSWEEMSRGDYPCPCGKGTYTRILDMDDWNRIREFTTMNCPVCAEKERAEEERLKKEDQRLSELDKEIKAYFAANYIEEWLTYFAPAKNKKQTWELAAKLRVETKSLSTFYSIKYSSKETYIRSLATYRNMEKIMRALNINDSKLANEVEEAIELYKKEYGRAVANWHRNH